MEHNNVNPYTVSVVCTLYYTLAQGRFQLAQLDSLAPAIKVYTFMWCVCVWYDANQHMTTTKLQLVLFSDCKLLMDGLTS